MKKIIIFLILLLFSVTLLTGCGSGAHIGDVNQSGGWIYYINNGSLYKMKTDWTGKTKLTDKAYQLRIDGETIYYLDDSVICNLFKINADGTGNMKLSDDIVSSFAVSDNWIYYSTKKSNDEMNDLEKKSPPDKLTTIIVGGVYKMKTDGSEKKKLADIDLTSGVIRVSDNWIYYTNSGGIYKMMIDGTGKTKVAHNAGLQVVKDNWIYYTYDEVHQFMYRIKTDGTEKTQIVNDNTADFNLNGNYIYYSVHGGNGIYRVNLDGTEKIKISNISINEIKGIYGEWIYYGGSSGNAYRINMDGSEKMKFK